MPKYKDKSKLFVIRKIMERIPEKLSEETLSQQVSEILFERDYMKVAELLAEYRKGELQKMNRKKIRRNARENKAGLRAFSSRPVSFVALMTSVTALFSTSSCMGHPSFPA